MIVVDLDSGFVDRTTIPGVVAARDQSDPTHLHPISGTMALEDRLRHALVELGISASRRVPVFLPIHNDLPTEVGDYWCRVFRSFAVDPFIVQRPLAAAAWLGLEMPGRAHLLLETSERLVEVSVVVDGVVSSRLIGAADGGWRTVYETIVCMLANLDPDQELDIRDSGIHVYGADRSGAQFLADMSGLEVAQPVADHLSVARGTQVIARSVLGWLPEIR